MVYYLLSQENNMDNNKIIDQLVPKLPQEDFDIVYVLDRSGSMNSIRQSVIEATNDFINEQRKEGGNCFFSLIQFDSIYGDPAYWRKPIDEVEALTEQTFKPRGGTALFDAIAKSVKHVQELRKDGTIKGKVQFVVQTDGDENASEEYLTREAVTEFVKLVQDEEWGDFIFLGANIDAFSEGSGMGFTRDKTANYANNAGGVRGASMFASANTKMFRYNAEMDAAATASLQEALEKGEDITDAYMKIDASIDRS